MNPLTLNHNSKWKTISNFHLWLYNQFVIWHKILSLEALKAFKGAIKSGFSNNFKKLQNGTLTAGKKKLNWLLRQDLHHNNLILENIFLTRLSLSQYQYLDKSRSNNTTFKWVELQIGLFSPSHDPKSDNKNSTITKLFFFLDILRRFL